VSDLQDQILQWLGGEGYPLEMRVAAAFQALEFGVAQGVYYSDPEKTTWRETDVHAFEEELYPEITVRVSFVVECKTSRDHPWLVFIAAGGALLSRAHLRFTPTTEIGRPFPVRLMRRAEILALPLFGDESSSGYGVVQALGKNDQSYPAVMSVSKAAVALAAETDRYSGVDPVLELVFPVIVVDAPLFECRLGSDGEPELTRVKRANLLWNNPAIGRGRTAIDVVSAEILEEYVSAAVESARYILKNSHEEVDLTTRKFLKDQGQVGNQ
jgi:hypothetical protein